MRPGRKPIWTPSLIERAQKLRAGGMAYVAIDEALGLRRGATHNKLRILKLTPIQIALRNEARHRYNQNYFKEHRQTKTKSVGPRDYIGASLTEELTAERDARRVAADRRTQTQTFFGDPPPGFSALDAKRNGRTG